MLQQPGARAAAAGVGAGAAVDVVVQLEVSHPEVADQEVHDLVQVLDRGRMAQVQVIPAVLDYLLPVALEERLGRELPGDRAAHPDDLRLQPDARDQAGRP